MRPKTLVTTVIATAALIVMISVVMSRSEHNINAQMMMGGHGGFGNMTSGLQEPQQKMMTINGTINLEQTIAEQFVLKLILH
jgi:hypothetical protein